MKAVLGRRYRDVVTGFEGIAVSSTIYLQGCFRVCLERLDKDGAPQSFAFDEPNLELVDEGVEESVPGAAAGALSGGPHDHTSTLDRH